MPHAGLAAMLLLAPCCSCSLVGRLPSAGSRSARVTHASMRTTQPSGARARMSSSPQCAPLVSRRSCTYVAAGAMLFSSRFAALERLVGPASASTPRLDVNNAVATEFTAFPGLYPTIASKLIKRGPFQSKKDMYQALDSDAERERLRAYDQYLIVGSRDSDVLQYKNAGVYFRGKGGDSRSSSSYRDAEIKALQLDRR